MNFPVAQSNNNTETPSAKTRSRRCQTSPGRPSPRSRASYPPRQNDPARPAPAGSVCNGLPAAIQAHRDDLDIALQDYSDAVNALRDVLREISSVSDVDITLRDIEADNGQVYLWETDAVLELFAGYHTAHYQRIPALERHKKFDAIFNNLPKLFLYIDEQGLLRFKPFKCCGRGVGCEHDIIIVSKDHYLSVAQSGITLISSSVEDAASDDPTDYKGLCDDPYIRGMCGYIVSLSDEERGRDDY